MSADKEHSHRFKNRSVEYAGYQFACHRISFAENFRAI